MPKLCFILLHLSSNIRSIAANILMVFKVSGGLLGIYNQRILGYRERVQPSPPVYKWVIAQRQLGTEFPVSYPRASSRCSKVIPKTKWLALD